MKLSPNLWKCQCICKLLVFEENQWKERGAGYLRINRPKEKPYKSARISELPMLSEIVEFAVAEGFSHSHAKERNTPGIAECGSGPRHDLQKARCQCSYIRGFGRGGFDILCFEGKNTDFQFVGARFY